MRVARLTLAFVGIVAIILALFGFGYNLLSLSADFSKNLRREVETYFYPAFYTMSAICIGCYALLTYVGVQLLRGKTDITRLLILLLLFEFLYFVVIAFLWTNPDYGMSIGAATGVANGGLMLQAFTLFPLWAPVAAFLASRSLRDA